MTERCDDRVDVLVIGAGPVGLLLACRLARFGLSFRVIERQRERCHGSRAIGIHPPCVEMLESLGLLARVLDHGVRVQRGLALGSRGVLGCVDFARAGWRHPYVLASPQAETECVLEQALREQGHRVERGLEVRDVAQDGEQVSVRAVAADGDEHVFHARFVVGCDGKRSVVRSSAGIEWSGRVHPGWYAMADFPDETPFGSVGVVFLADEGQVESFPLPGCRRRWVVRFASKVDGPIPELLADEVARRTGHRVDVSRVREPSGFRAESCRARSFVSSRVLLAGDSAHVVSPVGGQGMNLGWLDAWSLAVLLAGLVHGSCGEEAARRWARRRAIAARRATRRATLDMRLGQRTSFPRLRNATVRALLRPPVDRVSSAVFTMSGV